MVVQDVIAIQDFWGRSVAQSEKCEKDRNKEDEEYLETADCPTRFPTIRVNPFGPTLDYDQGNGKREYAQMEKKCFPSQFANLSIVIPKKLATKTQIPATRPGAAANAMIFRMTCFMTLCLAPAIV